MNRDKVTGLFATAMAIGLMASWSAFAAGNQKSDPQVRSLEATVFVNEPRSTQAPIKKPGVKVSVQPLSPKAKCSGQDQKELSTSEATDKPTYSFTTTSKPGDDYGKVFFQRCERGQYQVSVEVPKGMKLQDPNKQHQIVRLDPKRTTSVDFRMEKQK